MGLLLCSATTVCRSVVSAYARIYYTSIIRVIRVIRVIRTAGTGEMWYEAVVS